MSNANVNAAVPAIEISGLKKYFPLTSGAFGTKNGSVKAVDDINLTINKGEIIGLAGESGSGKTTFGRLVNGLIPCYYEGKLTGSVMVNGNDTTQLQLHELAGTVGSVFQNPKSQFYTLLTDTEVIFACENIGMEKREILRRFTETVQDFRLEKLLGKNVSQLSGGEKQKIACASVSMLRPPISNITFWFLTTATQPSGAPLPEPIRVPRPFLE